MSTSKNCFDYLISGTQFWKNLPKIHHFNYKEGNKSKQVKWSRFKKKKKIETQHKIHIYLNTRFSENLDPESTSWPRPKVNLFSCNPSFLWANQNTVSFIFDLKSTFHPSPNTLSFPLLDERLHFCLYFSLAQAKNWCSFGFKYRLIYDLTI